MGTDRGGYILGKAKRGSKPDNKKIDKEDE